MSHNSVFVRLTVNDFDGAEGSQVHRRRLASTKLMMLLLCCLLCPLRGWAEGQGWRDAEIGDPAVAGGRSVSDGALIVTGAGKGDGAESDQLHYTYQTVAPGDVEVIARLALLNGAPHARAGIMLRADNAPTATEALVAFALQDATDANHQARNTVHALCRDMAAPYAHHGSGTYTALQAPLWLRIDRIGRDCAVYKSSDGKIWSQVQNESGGAFTPSGAFNVGFFVAGGAQGQSATAQFDHIAIGKPHMGYRTSWIGNSYSQDSKGYVSNGIGALWVGPDGTCYTNSYYDEAGESAKIYKNGRVVKNFENEPFGNDTCGEGTITGDGKRMFLASGHGIYVTDLLGHSSATKRLFFAADLWDQAKNINVTSGMAVVNGQLFVGDERDNKILIARTDYQPYYTAGNTTTNVTRTPIDTLGVANAAPQAVYRSQRECDYLPYQIPKLTPNGAYTVRLHFAEYTENQSGRRLINIGAGGQSVRNFDVVVAAGGRYKAVVLEVPNAKADRNGVLSVVLERGEGGDGHIVICGIEILMQDRTPIFRLNCGGSAVEDFQSDVSELPQRAFACERPGPMVADRRGDLWILREANDFPVGNAVTTKYPGAIRCYHPDGTFTGKEITDVVNPTAVAYDPVRDRLLVAENGPNQNIRLYTDLATAPRYSGGFGARGGIYSGKTPGRLYDPGAGGWARFYAPNGVGMDAEGNIYVSCSASGTDLRKYTPEGRLVWMLNALHFVDCADADPDSDGTELYDPFKRYTLDYAHTQPGGEWKYTAYLWNPFKYGPAPRPNASSAVVRRLGSQRARILFTSGQGAIDYAGIYRFEGEIAVPCGRIEEKGQNRIWIDRNGDGKETPDEVLTLPRPGSLQSYAVDQKGDIWTVWMGDTPVLRHFRFKGLSAKGVPLYGTGKGDYEDIPYPGTGAKINTWGQGARCSYDAASDVMYLLGPANDRKSDKENSLSYLARYDRWSKGNRRALWLITLPDPDTNPDFVYTSPNPYGLAFQWEAFDMAGDKVFVAELWGPVHIFDAATGRQELVLNAGPEVSGGNAWEDEQMGVRAWKRKNGEYVICTENSGFRGKNNLFRWMPEPTKP